VARKTYSEEFRRDAVGAVSGDAEGDGGGDRRGPGGHGHDVVGVVEGRWVPLRFRTSGDRSGPPPDSETLDQELARLRARVAELEAAERKLNSERDILRVPGCEIFRCRTYEHPPRGLTNVDEVSVTPLYCLRRLD
jgi:transposase